MLPSLASGGGAQSLQGGAGGSAANTTTNSSGFNIGGFTFGSGSAKVSARSGSVSPWLIGGIAAAALVGVWLVMRKK